MQNSVPDTLPAPDALSKQRSLSLMQHICDACSLTVGGLTFAEYMNISLYEPALGYYSGGLQKFGEAGDFITAPEVSPLFGQCLANQLKEILQNMQSSTKDETTVIEFGAGSGALVVDLLSALESLDALPDRYMIVELSAELQQRQKQQIEESIPHLLYRVSWLQSLPGSVQHAVVIANEVLDAMPVEIFRVKENSVQLMRVNCDEGELRQVFVDASAEVENKIAEIEQRSEITFSDEYVSEYNPSIQGWLSALSSSIEQMVLLAIDYGYNEKEYFHPDRRDGTLMCYYRHRAHTDFFWWPGLQDITAFVNFTDVAYNAVDLGMEISGYTTQAGFLLSNGLSELHEQQVSDELQQQITLSQQVKTLTLPSEMGDRFKVIAVSKNYGNPLRGFSMLDLRNRL